jgi:hypothetical protein
VGDPTYEKAKRKRTESVAPVVEQSPTKYEVLNSIVNNVKAIIKLCLSFRRLSISFTSILIRKTFYILYQYFNYLYILFFISPNLNICYFIGKTVSFYSLLIFWYPVNMWWKVSLALYIYQVVFCFYYHVSMLYSQVKVFVYILRNSIASGGICVCCLLTTVTKILKKIVLYLGCPIIEVHSVKTIIGIKLWMLFLWGQIWNLNLLISNLYLNLFLKNSFYSLTFVPLNVILTIQI